MNFIMGKDRHGRDHMVLGFTTTCAIIADHHYSCKFESHSWQERSEESIESGVYETMKVL